MSVPHIKHRPRVGVAVILWRGEQVLLGERINLNAANCWQFPGGHLEADESIIECAQRELAEETGLSLAVPRLLTMTNQPFFVSGKRYVTLLVSAEWHEGEAMTREPEKCRQWRWFDYRNLPAQLFEPITLVLNQLKQQDDDLLAMHCRSRIVEDIPSDEHK